MVYDNGAIEMAKDTGAECGAHSTFRHSNWCQEVLGYLSKLYIQRIYIYIYITNVYDVYGEVIYIYISINK